LRKYQPGLGDIVAAERRLAVQGEPGGVQPGGYVVSGDAAGGVRGHPQRAQRLTVHSEAGQRGLNLQVRIAERPRALRGKAQFPGHGQTAAAKDFDAGSVDSRALGVQLEAAGLEVVAARDGNPACAFDDGLRGEIDLPIGQRSLRADVVHRLAVDAAFVHLSPSGAVQRMERSVDLKLRIEGASYGQAPAGEQAHIVHADPVRAQAEMEHRVGVDGRRVSAARHCVQRAVEGYLGAAATQQAAKNFNSGCRIAAGGLDRIKPDELGLAGIDRGQRRQLEGQLRRLEVARQVRIDQGAGPRAVKIRLSRERDGQGGGAGFTPRRRRSLAGNPGVWLAGQAQIAQHGVEFAQVLGVEIDRQRRGAGERVGAQMAAGLDLTGGQIELQGAQIDRAVPLGIGAVDQAAGGNHSGGGL
jgi:hypothetical protein